jgi:hypothetical protein
MRHNGVATELSDAGSSGGPSQDKSPPGALADALGLVRRFVQHHYPEAVAALLAGRRARGDGKGNSD